MKQDLTETNELEDSLSENLLLQFSKIPWIFQHIIPTQLEVDGIKFPIDQTIDLMDFKKTYGHYRLRLVFVGFIKSKVVVVNTRLSEKKMRLVFRGENWLYYLFWMLIVAYLIFSKPFSILGLIVKISAFLLFSTIDLLTNFVRIEDENSDS